MSDLDPRITRIVERQYGVIARRQLVRQGMSHAAISRRLASARFIPVHPGVYAVGHASLSRRGRELAAVLSVGESALLSHRAAAALWGLIDAVEVIEVLAPTRRAPRRRGVRVRRTAGKISKHDRRLRNHIPVTSPLRTLLDLAAISGFADLELAVARGLQRGLVTDSELRDRVAAEHGRPGNPRLRTLLDGGDGPRLTRSELEQRFLARVREAGLPTPETEVRLHPYVLDFLWREERVVVETDGFETHGTRAAFDADRARDADLKSRGLEVVRFTWRQIDHESTRVVARVAAVLAIARERSHRGS
ncbi:type IV toxin-antitoxin system AbiEi family antitoxin domain-containing protein [Thermoleophilia bacterium SCSIO 60948]|nr:type IV toxin-antitoxin system AbiEi family antitoxin domain-containing protein [Thermoleophilia bacterium SCSIO 60948]